MAEDDFDGDEEWDEDVVIEVRRFAVEQALTAHLHKRDSAADLTSVFNDADRIVKYILGEIDP